MAVGLDIFRNQSLKSWGLRLALGALVAMLLSYLPYRLVRQSGDEKLGEMRSELMRTQRENEELRRDIRERRQVVESLKHDRETIESIAREQLQMLYPHEVTFRLEDNQ